MCLLRCCLFEPQLRGKRPTATFLKADLGRGQAPQGSNYSLSFARKVRNRSTWMRAKRPIRCNEGATHASGQEASAAAADSKPPHGDLRLRCGRVGGAISKMSRRACAARKPPSPESDQS